MKLIAPETITANGLPLFDWAQRRPTFPLTRAAKRIKRRFGLSDSMAATVAGHAFGGGAE